MIKRTSYDTASPQMGVQAVLLSLPDFLGVTDRIRRASIVLFQRIGIFSKERNKDRSQWQNNLICCREVYPQKACWLDPYIEHKKKTLTPSKLHGNSVARQQSDSHVKGGIRGQLANAFHISRFSPQQGKVVLLLYYIIYIELKGFQLYKAINSSIF